MFRYPFSRFFVKFAPAGMILFGLGTCSTRFREAVVEGTTGFLFSLINLAAQNVFTNS
jgi:hypothetical protein